MPRIVSIQSHVLHGHVGNAAAVPAMAALGMQVTAVPTTLLSNHPHYPTMRGRILDAQLVADLLVGLEERGLVDEASMLVTGFLGSAAIGEVVTDFVARALRRNPHLRYICDPVLGDEDVGTFAAPGLTSIFRDRLLPMAWLATPNRWEAELLTGISASPRDLLAELRRLGPERAIVTGGHSADAELRTLVLDERRAWTIRSPRLPVRPAGTGDLFTGIVAAELANGRDLIAAAKRAVGIVHRLLCDMGPDRWSEMPIEHDLAAAIAAPEPFEPSDMGEMEP